MTTASRAQGSGAGKRLLRGSIGSSILKLHLIGKVLQILRDYFIFFLVRQNRKPERQHQYSETAVEFYHRVGAIWPFGGMDTLAIRRVAEVGSFSSRRALEHPPSFDLALIS